jgi:lipopolysaccharide/colanic/teichoic acid biosynthesis glycosyltransferase
MSRQDASQAAMKAVFPAGFVLPAAQSRQVYSITGWAQVNGARGATPTLEVMQRRVEFDAWYVTHANFALDLKILARRPLEVVRPRSTT